MERDFVDCSGLRSEWLASAAAAREQKHGSYCNPELFASAMLFEVTDWNWHWKS